MAEEFDRRLLREYRCVIDNSLLCKALGDGQVEIKNPKNRYINYLGPARPKEGGKVGLDFNAGSVDLRCKKCKRLLGRAIGYEFYVEIKCSHSKCNELNFYDIKEIKNKMYAGLSTKAFEEGLKNKSI